MSDTQCWGRLWLGHMLSLVLLILAGCGGSNEPGGSTTAVEMSQLILHVTTTDQQSAGLMPRAVTPGQTRQGEPVTRLRVEVSGPDIPMPIVVECPLSGPVTPQCEVTETPDAFIVTIALLVPVGTERLVVVTGLDQTGAAILRGVGTVDLTQPLQTVTVMLTPVQSNTPPRADAGPDQTVAVGTTVMLLGNGSSDADGDPLTFAWVLLVRPPGSQATLANPTSVNPTFVVDRPGIYMVQLTVNDGQVDSQPDVVTINTVNSAPVANAGEAQTVTVGTTVILQGNRSSDVDGDPLTFRWAFLTRPTGSQATFSDPTAVNPMFAADRPGTYIAQLLVNDGTLESLPATVTITTLNSRPLANAGPHQPLGLVGQIIQLDGSGSSDADGDPLSFRWALTTRPAGSQATLTNSTLVNPTFVADVLGTYVAQLLVNDGTLESLPATVTITTLNSRPLANAGPHQSLGSVGQIIQLDGSGSSDADGDPLSFRWALTTRPAGSQATLANSTLVNPTFVADVFGTYVAQLLVNDGTLESLPATVTITVDNLPPMANAGPDQPLVAVRQTVQLDGSGSSDADGDPLSFRWAFTSLPPGSQATLSDPTIVNPTFVPDALGTFVVQLVVNDGIINSLPDTVTITAENIRPVADAGPDQPLVSVPQTIQLDGSASSDADADSLTFRWAFTSRPPDSQATLSDSTAVSPTFGADVIGTFVVQLIMNDGIVDSLADTVLITADNIRPVANAGADQTIFVTQTAQLAQLDGSGSSDADSNPLSFRWAFTSLPPGSQATLSDPTIVNPTFVADVLGTYVLQLLVNDGTVDSQPDTVTIIVSVAPPIDLFPVPGPPVDGDLSAFCNIQDGLLLVTISNQGTTDAPRSVTRVTFSSLPVEQEPVDQGSVDQATPAIAAGSSTNVSFAIPPGCFNLDCGIVIEVDVNQEIVETDEGNNGGSSICFLGGPIIDG